MSRLAILDYDRCQPRRCSMECMKYCPGVRMEEETIVMDENLGKPIISEELCSGCGICTKRCPFGAIRIIGLPEELTDDRIVHSYGQNRFRLYGLITPRDGVTGLLGPNGVGKSTIIKALSGEMVLNLNDLTETPDMKKVLDYFSGTELQNYFEKLKNNGIKPIHKPQYVDVLPKVVKGKVGELLKKVDEKGEFEKIINALEISNILDRTFDQLSGGELQRVAIAAACLREGDIYYFDEPTSWLDVKQRFSAAKVIREVAEGKKVVAV